MFEDIDDILLDADDRMEKSITALQHELRTIRTGRASSALVDHIPVIYYGAPTALNQLATVSIPEPRLIAVKPFSPSDINDIQKAIQNSDLGITPSNDGKIIRLVVPPLTEERRRDLVKKVGNYVEESKIACRNIRRDANDDIKSLEKDKKISEDEMHDGLKEVQDMVGKFEKRIDEIGKEKESEIMEF